MCTKVSAVCYRFPRHRSWHMRRRWHCFCAPRVSTHGPCVQRMCQAAVRTARHKCRVHHVRRCSVIQRAARVGCSASSGGQAGSSAFPGSATHCDKKPRALLGVRWARLPWLLLECSLLLRGSTIPDGGLVFECVNAIQRSPILKAWAPTRWMFRLASL